MAKQLKVAINQRNNNLFSSPVQFSFSTNEILIKESTNLNGIQSAIEYNGQDITLSGDDPIIHLVSTASAGGTVVVNLPDTGVESGKIFIIKKTDASVNGIDINAGTFLIEGVASQGLAAQYSTIHLICNGFAYFILSRMGS